MPWWVKQREWASKNQQEALNSGWYRKFQFDSKKDVEVAQQKYVSPNTEKSTQLVTKVFANWKQARQLAGEECCPEDLLEQADPSYLAKWLSLFVVEAWQASGNFYSLPTIPKDRYDTIR